ncbi:hypothetical protein PFMC_06014, partial [Plasmodium falciparum CAMP/Malaysia]
IYNQRNHNSTTPHTPKIPTTRSLCECELYSPANYNNDPQMKEVMQQFEDRTSQRFHEYDDRMKTTRQKCKEQCDKEIQKIILKDKVEKELMDKFATLQTDIQSDAIPTCVCEKSIEDKVEKTCLKCGGVLGGGIAPTFGLIGSVAINMWKTTEIAAATKAAIAKGTAKGAAAGLKAGVDAVISEVSSLFGASTLDGEALGSVINVTSYTNDSEISGYIYAQYEFLQCGSPNMFFGQNKPIFCTSVHNGMAAKNVGWGGTPKNFIKTIVEEAVAKGTQAANDQAAKVAAAEKLAIETAEKSAIEAASMQLYTTIAYSILAILIIVLIMVIIYLILRYRRKKKMKKKLQYIKLLEE